MNGGRAEGQGGRGLSTPYQRRFLKQPVVVSYHDIRLQQQRRYHGSAPCVAVPAKCGTLPTFELWLRSRRQRVSGEMHGRFLLD
jgi:hypothetical protein